MMEPWFNSSLMLVAIPILGALFGLSFWKWPRVFTVWALMCLAATGLVLIAYSGAVLDDPSSDILVALMVLGAFLAVLGQAQEKDTSAILFLILLLLGLGVGFLTSTGVARISYLAEIFGVVGLALFYYGFYASDSPGEVGWGSLGLYGLGLTCLAVSVAVSGSMAAMMLVVAFAVAFPLFPFHGAFVATLSNLPGSLPAFLVVLLPSLGFSGVSVLIPSLPEWLMHGVLVVALLSALYGALKALAQFRMGHLLAYAYLAQMSIVWWYAAVSEAMTPQVLMYFSALALVTSGLYLAGHHLHARFGHLDMDKLGGVAHSMPRFATILVVLITAAMGLPLFGVFSAFFVMMIHVSPAFLWSTVVILAIWLMVSWHYPLLMHRVLFGRPVGPAFAHRDLAPHEWFPLILMVLALMLAGLIPSDVVSFTHSPVLSLHVEEVGTWKP